MKKVFSIILLSVLFFSVVSFTQAAEIATPSTTIVDYPSLEGAITPGQAKEGEELPQLIKYIFTFSLGVVGILGLLMIIYGGFIYLTSVGNPQKATEAKDRILSALLGIVLLLGSYLLLNIINPDLLKLGITLKPAEIDSDKMGNYICFCCDGKNCEPEEKIGECRRDTYKKSLSRCGFNCKELYGTKTRWGFFEGYDDTFEYRAKGVSSCKTVPVVESYSCTCSYADLEKELWACKKMVEGAAASRVCLSDCKEYLPTRLGHAPRESLINASAQINKSCKND